MSMSGSPKSILQSQMYALLPQRDRPLRVLEAGCGSESQIPLDAGWHLTGIDVSERQLESNPLLDERVLGSLEEHRWPPGTFDIVICYDVIEHLPNPRAALANMVEGLADGGLLVLAFPNVRSVKGWVTKRTPYRAHVYFYRFIMGYGKTRAEDNVFPTYLRPEIRPEAIADFACTNNLEICFRLEYEGWAQSELRRMHRLADRCFKLIEPLNWNNSDVMMILRKPSTFSV
jgi:SAM-dependent methyltransferase